MPHTLRNENLEVQIDLPDEGYQLARFDWTGKIVGLNYRGRLLSSTELANSTMESPDGKGLYNEFGIDTPVGYAEIKPGDWFHKIGVGLLQKTGTDYDFSCHHPIQPATFTVQPATDRVVLTCRSAHYNGYAYLLRKEIELQENGLAIHYQLRNTGEKVIQTTEYVHNFLAIDGTPVAPDYQLRFPFDLRVEKFIEQVDPEGLVRIGIRDIQFTGQPTQPFFFSNLTGGDRAQAHWELENHRSQIGISETGDFPTRSVNLWGWGHVISPELFIDIDLAAGQTQSWSRVYRIYETSGR